MVQAFAFAEALRVKITFIPEGERNLEVIILDDDSSDFSKLIIKKIEKAKPKYFYCPHKEDCEEGFYKIYIYRTNTINKYEVFEKTVIYDVDQNCYLKYDFLSELYEYLGKKKLEEVVNNSKS